MKTSHLGIKISVAVLIGIILISYLVYWQSISMLSSHMTSLVAASNHLQNGDLFHSSVHSMMMDTKGNADKDRYLKDRNRADKAILKLQTYLDSHNGPDMKTVSQHTANMAMAYKSFRKITETLLNRENQMRSMRGNRQVQTLFDTIFNEYQKLHTHHTQHREDLLKKTKSIQKTINFVFALQLILGLLAGVLVILYLDRMVLKVFDMTEKLALHDKLTGLYNRHALDRIVSGLTSSKENRDKGYGLLLLDIDHFKKFNDTYGHPAGDQLLKRMAELLLQIVRSQDKIIRFGGEEILIILSWVDLSGAEQVARKICSTIEKTPFDLKDGAEPKKVTVSIGYSSSSFDKGSFEELLNIADKRLYGAKESGRNRVAGP
jgi:diguanylate cyclase (GGDEF)-like protein